MDDVKQLLAGIIGQLDAADRDRQLPIMAFSDYNRGVAEKLAGDIQGAKSLAIRAYNALREEEDG